jgi:hypothetical protein
MVDENDMVDYDEDDDEDDFIRSESDKTASAKIFGDNQTQGDEAYDNTVVEEDDKLGDEDTESRYWYCARCLDAFAFVVNPGIVPKILLCQLPVSLTVCYQVFLYYFSVVCCACFS